jgi:hypothetical protein
LPGQARGRAPAGYLENQGCKRKKGKKDARITNFGPERGNDGHGVLGPERRLLIAKEAFLFGLSAFFRPCGCFQAIPAKNCSKLLKKLLPLMDLTIIIKSLVVRINSCQYEKL